MEDVDGGLHPAVDGQSLDEDEDEEISGSEKSVKQKSRIKLPILPSHGILTPGQPVPTLTQQRQAPDSAATKAPMSELLIGTGCCWLVGKSPSKRISGTDLLRQNCHTGIEIAGQTCYLTQSQYVDTWPTSPSTDPVTSNAWQVSPRSAKF